jgi:hypothetical protein
VEWLKVEALSSNPNTEKNKKESKFRVVVRVSKLC